MTEASRISRLLRFLLRCNLTIFNNIEGWDQTICYNTSVQNNHWQEQTAAPSSSKLSAPRPFCLRAFTLIPGCQSHHRRCHYTSTAFDRLQPQVWENYKDYWPTTHNKPLAIPQVPQSLAVQTGYFSRTIDMVLPMPRSPLLPSSGAVTAPGHQQTLKS